jgi:hypothetical protein
MLYHAEKNQSMLEYIEVDIQMFSSCNCQKQNVLIRDLKIDVYTANVKSLTKYLILQL